MGSIVSAKKPSLLEKMAEEYSLEPAKFWEGVKATIAPSKSGGQIASDAEIMTYLMVAQQYKLNPFLREIHGFVGKGGKVQVIVGVDGWIKIVNRQPNYGGFEMLHKLDEKGALVSITCKMKVRDDALAQGFRIVEMTEYMSECRMPNKEPWDKWPARMLHHKAFIQAARYAFGVTGVMDEDEADRYEREIDVTPGKSAFSPPQEVKKAHEPPAQPQSAKPETTAAVPPEGKPSEPAPPATTPPQTPADSTEKASEQQVKKINVCLTELGSKTDEERHKYVKSILGVTTLPLFEEPDGTKKESIKGLSKRDASTVIETLVKAAAQKGQQRS